MPNGMTAEPRAINDAGHVVGRGKVYVPDPPDWEYHAFLWDGEEIIDLGTLPFCENSFASDINNDGIIVGRSGIPSIAFLWRDGQMHKLNDLVHPPFPGSLRGANAINEAGQIVAYGYGNFDGLVTVLLSPIPPPIGDLDGDCTVGVADLMILLSEWGSSVSPADLNGDHIVDVVDLLILLDNWS
jgi:probable HAF family extracellular repeat protein